jgi:hypothetical protein
MGLTTAQYSVVKRVLLCRPPSSTHRTVPSYLRTASPALTQASNMKFSSVALASVLICGPTSAWTANHAPSRWLASTSSSSTSLSSTASSSIVTEVVGEKQTESFRLAFKDGESALSPWHDIPLQNDDGSYNMVSTARTLFHEAGKSLSG